MKIVLSRKGMDIGLLMLFFAMFLTACNVGETGQRGYVVQNDESDMEKKNELPDYAFAIDGYVEIQKGKVDSIRVTDYLPDKAMTLRYKDMTVQNGLQYYYNLYPNAENVQYEGVSSLDMMAHYSDGSSNTSTGYYYYDKEADCLAEVYNRLSTDTAYLIPMGKSLEVMDGTTIQNLPYLFTVTCEAGIYKDCVAVMETTDFSTPDESKEITTVNYYAKGIGKILSVSNIQNGGRTFLVTDILLKITDLNENGSQDNKNNVSSNVNYNWWENKRYVSTQTGRYFDGFRYSSEGEPYFAFGNCCVPIFKGKVEIIEHDHFGTLITYTFPTIMRRGNSIINDEYYVIYYIERDEVEAFNASGTYSDRFYYDATYQPQSKSNTEETNDFLTFPFSTGQQFECFETETGKDVMDGRQFECFETKSGEYVKLAFRTSRDNSLLCFFNEGSSVAVSYNENIEGYEGYPNDDVNARIIIKLNEKGDIEFTSSGQYEGYSGTYIEIYD